MIKAVIFDLDDTMCLTEEGCWKVENQTLLNMGRQQMSRAIHQETWGKKLFEEAIELRSPGIDVQEFRDAFDPVFRTAIETGQLDKIPPENLEAMDRLLDMGKALVLLTSRERIELEHLLAPDHDLASRVEAFYYKDNMQFHKPDPRAFEHIEREHGWKPGECVYVGDSLGDAKSAKGAGIHFIASLESGLRSKQDFIRQQDAPVDLYIHTFPEVVEAVQQLDITN
jgi:phosphoglycolate phosphatase